MDPTKSQLDSDFSQQDTPCLIVEDSQPESLGTEDDLDRARFGLLPQHLQSNLDSPVLEYVQGCQNNKHSFGDKERMEVTELSKENHKVESMEPTHTPGEDAALSQVIDRIPCPANAISSFNCDESIEAEEAADCSTQSLEVEDSGTSQLAFGVLELSQSQDIDSQHSRDDDEDKTVPHMKPQTLECIQEEPDNVGAETEKENVTDQNMEEDPKRNQESGTAKTSSCNVDEKNTNTAQEDQQKESSVVEPLESRPDEEMECDLASSQEDLFGQADVLVSPNVPKIVSTPADSLRLLHFSGQTSLTSVTHSHRPCFSLPR